MRSGWIAYVYVRELTSVSGIAMYIQVPGLEEFAMINQMIQRTILQRPYIRPANTRMYRDVDAFACVGCTSCLCALLYVCIYIIRYDLIWP